MPQRPANRLATQVNNVLSIPPSELSPARVGAARIHPGAVSLIGGFILLGESFLAGLDVVHVITALPVDIHDYEPMQLW